ncbi:MAG: hypothetical protein ACKVT0_18770 [Planctomycetaceae bacterium]
MPIFKDGQLDRRWIFLMMFLVVAAPILFQLTFPEKPSPKVLDLFAAIDRLPDGSRVFVACDYDPASAGELQPMIFAFVRHCAEKNHKMIFMALWPQGVSVIKQSEEILNEEYPAYKYGTDYVNFGYQPGNEVVLKVLVNDFKKQCKNDVNGTSVSDLPLTASLTKIQQLDLVISVSTGNPGTTEWVQYVASPYGVRMVAGTTAVQAPSLYPYMPRQLIGVLGGIKAAAEYEQTIIEKYPALKENQGAREGLRRMGPQLLGHLLIVGLIVLGNILHFSEKRKGAGR